MNTTDLALPTGSEINPFVWRRSIAAQSKDFQVASRRDAREIIRQEDSIADLVSVYVHDR